LLVTIDTLRADHLSCYGYERETSPHLDALAAEGVLFERALSTSGSTLPAHLSIFTGLLPHQHGFLSNKRALMGPYQPAPGRTTAAQVFAEAGYTTWAVVSGNTVKRPTGIHSGFQVWDQPETLHRKGEDTSAIARSLLARYAEEGARRPFFLWVHFWDVHEPNDPPEPYRSMFRADAKMDELLHERRVDAARLQERFTPTEIARLFDPELVIPLLKGEELPVPPIDQDRVRSLYDAYDGSIRYVDDQIGLLLEDLETHGLGAETIVAVVADHGQALGQHDWLEHGRVQREEVHVPMILRFPGDRIAQRRRETRLVSTIDLLPTIVARLDHPAFRAFAVQGQGRDLLDSGFDRSWAFSHRSDRERGWEPGRMVALEQDGWRFYDSESSADRLFDLNRDAGELEDVAASEEERAQAMRELVRSILSLHPSDGSTSGKPDPTDRDDFEEGLQQMGYLGSEED
jgi:arylsulfatase